MQVFLIYILFLLILHLLLTTVSKRNHSKFEMLFCGVAYLGLIVLAAFRGPTVGADTLDYISDYNEINKYSFSEVIEIYSGYEFFYLICKLFKLIDLPLATWFAFIEIIYVSAIARLIHKDSTDKIYSIILFITIGLYMFSLAGLKQTMAMGLILHAFMELRNKRYFTTVLLFFMAFFAHPTALVFLPAFLFYICRSVKHYNLILICFSVLFAFSLKYILASFLNVGRLDHFGRYLEINTSYSIWTLLFYILMIIVSIPFIKSYSKNCIYKNEPRFEMTCLIIACCLQFLASLSPSLFRLALYYTPFFLIYMPNVLYVRSDVARKVIKLIVILGIVFFYAYTNRNFVYSLA